MFSSANYRKGTDLEICIKPCKMIRNKHYKSFKKTICLCNESEDCNIYLSTRIIGLLESQILDLMMKLHWED